MTYDIFMSANMSGITQVITVNQGIGSTSIDAIYDEFVTSMTSSGFENAQVGAPVDRTIDGAKARDVTFSAVSSGTAMEGAMTFVFEDSSTSIVVSAWAQGDTQTANECAQIHNSVRLASVVGTYPAPSASSSTAGSSSVGVGTGSAAGTAAGTPSTGAVTGTPGTSTVGVAPSAKADGKAASSTKDAKAGSKAAGAGTSSAAAGSVQTITFEGFQYQISADPATYVHTTINPGYESDMTGRAVIGVPVTVTNVGTAAASPADVVYNITTYGPTGLEQQDNYLFGVYLDDSIDNAPSMRPGASVTGMLYLADEGAGDYVLSFDDYTNPVQELTVTVK